MATRFTYPHDVEYAGTHAKANCELTYRVKGSGFFPVDMLRYDRVTPTTEEDSAVCEGFGADREVNVRGQGCTPKRWQSFGWTVVGVIVEDRK